MKLIYIITNSSAFTKKKKKIPQILTKLYKKILNN